MLFRSDRDKQEEMRDRQAMQRLELVVRLPVVLKTFNLFSWLTAVRGIFGGRHINTVTVEGIVGVLDKKRISSYDASFEHALNCRKGGKLEAHMREYVINHVGFKINTDLDMAMSKLDNKRETFLGEPEQIRSLLHDGDSPTGIYANHFMNELPNTDEPHLYRGHK